MASKHPALTPYARHLMSEIAAGRNRLWAMCEIPNGWIHIERAGLATREPRSNRNNDRAQLTPAGHEWIKVQSERFSK